MFTKLLNALKETRRTIVFTEGPDARILEAADRLLKEEKVGVVPGSCFGPQGKNHIRISYAASRENLAEALKRIGHFVDKYRKN